MGLARIPAKWNHFAEKDSRQINMLEQILIAKVFNFGGICSDVARDLAYAPQILLVARAIVTERSQFPAGPGDFSLLLPFDSRICADHSV